jgi:tRNA(Ile)-lysidine synthase
MLIDFLHFIRKHNLFSEKERILLAVSGGIDSMVMVDLFIRAGFSIGIAHCNFRLRGEESDADEMFVKKKAGETGCPYFIRHFETETYSREHGISIQMAARELRYGWFNTLVNQHGYDRIATAHHLNDNIETVLFNLIRGTGLKGLAGISIRQDAVIRPLLFAEKDQIIQYAAEQDIAYREDRSNVENKYHRNLVRNEIIPLIEGINPGFTRSMKSTIDRLDETYKLLDHRISEIRDTIVHLAGGHVFVDRPTVARINSPVLLHGILKVWGFNYDQCRDILGMEEAMSGSLFFSGTHVLNVDREKLIISPHAHRKDCEFDWPVERQVMDTEFGRFSKEKAEVNQPVKSGGPYSETFDLGRLKFPLKIRTWQNGDWFIPLGMKGKKKLSDFMIDKKIPVNLKQRIPVILSEESIIWVVGYRMDERFRVTPDSRNLLTISFEPIHDQSF